MKKFFTLFLFVLLFVCAGISNVHAQYGSKGIIEFGGSVAYASATAVNNGTAASESSSLFNFMPYANYFIVKGFSLGLSPGINIIKAAGQKESITNLVLSVFPGYTFSTNSYIFPYIEGSLGYTAVSQKTSTIGGTDLDLSGISYGAKGGIKVLVGKSGLLSVGVSYTLLNLNPKNPPAGADKRNGYNSLAINIGFSIFIE